MQQPHELAGTRLQLGDRGIAVFELRQRLAHLGLLCTQTSPDSDSFDAPVDRAVRLFQQQRGLRIDGVVDRETYRVLDEARWRLGDRILSYSVRHPYVGDDVAGLQQRLTQMGFDCGRADGVFGAHTENALRDFQRNVGLPADGTCGPETFRALRQLERTVVGGQANELREYERLHHDSPTLAGKFVVIDPGHGGSDLGARAGELNEAAIAEDIANRIEGRLTVMGAQAFLTRGGEGVLDGDDAPPSDGERAAFANAAEADLLVSLHVDGQSNPSCSGIATYYYGTPKDRSVLGARLADLIQEEVLARTDLLDCHTHAKSWELLRSTRMPAVRVEFGYLTNPHDAARLGEPAFRDNLAEAVVVAMQRLYIASDPLASTRSIQLADAYA